MSLATCVLLSLAAGGGSRSACACACMHACMREPARPHACMIAIASAALHRTSRRRCDAVDKTNALRHLPLRACMHAAWAIYDVWWHAVCLSQCGLRPAVHAVLCRATRPAQPSTFAAHGPMDPHRRSTPPHAHLHACVPPACSCSTGLLRQLLAAEPSLSNQVGGYARARRKAGAGRLPGRLAPDAPPTPTPQPGHAARCPRIGVVSGGADQIRPFGWAWARPKQRAASLIHQRLPEADLPACLCGP